MSEYGGGWEGQASTGDYSGSYGGQGGAAGGEGASNDSGSSGNETNYSGITGSLDLSLTPEEELQSDPISQYVSQPTEFRGDDSGGYRSTGYRSDEAVFDDQSRVMTLDPETGVYGPGLIDGRTPRLDEDNNVVSRDGYTLGVRGLGIDKTTYRADPETGELSKSGLFGNDIITKENTLGALDTGAQIGLSLINPYLGAGYGAVSSYLKDDIPGIAANAVGAISSMLGLPGKTASGLYSKFGSKGLAITGALATTPALKAVAKTATKKAQEQQTETRYAELEKEETEDVSFLDTEGFSDKEGSGVSTETTYEAPATVAEAPTAMAMAKQGYAGRSLGRRGTYFSNKRYS